MVKTSNNSEEKKVMKINPSSKKTGSEKGRTCRAHGKKDTFWNQVRVKSNITQKEVAQYLGCSKSLAGFFFSGQLVPKDEYMDKLCDLFNVDRIVGEREFRKANREWDTIHDGKEHPNFSAEVIKEPKPKTEPTKVVEKRSVIIKHEEEKSTMDIGGLHRAAFDMLDYDCFAEFTKLLNSRKAFETETDFRNEVDEFISDRVYGKVSRAQYDRIQKFFV